MTTSLRGGGGLDSTAVPLLSEFCSVGEVVVLLGERTGCSLDDEGEGKCEKEEEMSRDKGKERKSVKAGGKGGRRFARVAPA